MQPGFDIKIRKVISELFLVCSGTLASLLFSSSLSSVGTALNLVRLGNPQAVLNYVAQRILFSSGVGGSRMSLEQGAGGKCFCPRLHAL